MDQKIGAYAFLLGVILSILAGIGSGFVSAEISGYIALVLVILGVIVGFLNIGDKEITAFLVVAIALSLGGAANFLAIPYIGLYVAGIVQQIQAFVYPAAVVVALKGVYNLGSTPAK